jgi:hypothetical protein
VLLASLFSQHWDKSGKASHYTLQKHRTAPLHLVHLLEKVRFRIDLVVQMSVSRDFHWPGECIPAVSIQTSGSSYS